MATDQAQHAERTSGGDDQGRFRFTLGELLVVTGMFAFCFGAWSWSLGLGFLAPLLCIVGFLLFKTRGHVAPSVLSGFVFGNLLGLPVTINMFRFVDDRQYGYGSVGIWIVFVGALGAAFFACFHSISRGHVVLGWSILIFLGAAVLILFVLLFFPAVQ